jgi:serine/threonine protein kinase
MVARCLNPRGGHDNPESAVTCRRCEFLVEGARIGTYQVTAFIGSGSYGYVYQVREAEPLSRTLALKVLRFDQLNEKALSSFFDEARRIANLQHPNILPVYSFGQLEDERPYLVMEYAPQTIYDLFRKPDGSRRTAFAEELLPYVQQAAQALHYVHQNGLIHQDVKPGNLLIGRNGQLLLSDFGTTFYLGMQTHASLGEVTGTAAYMAPEQWQGQPRRETDQYALAICCYELLTGRLPFAFQRLEEMWRAHINEPPPSPQRWNARIPVEVAAVLLRAMAKDYHQRYRDLLQFADAYSEAVTIALRRYLCERCGFQNRSGAQRCSNCGSDYDGRSCPYCYTALRFGQRCCSVCGRLTIPATLVPHSPLLGISVRQGRYDIKRVLKSREETRVTTMVASDSRAGGKEVVLKRWECTDFPLERRARELAYYDRASEVLAHLRHPLVPSVLERFAEGRHYYLVLSYVDGESLEDRLQKLLRPLPEREVVVWLYSLLNTLAALEQLRPPIYHLDISPANIIIERNRARPVLTGFQIPPPPFDNAGQGPRRTTRKLAQSPYLPIKDIRYDRRTSIYMLAATMHHVLTNCAPPHYPSYPPVRLLNPALSPALEAILSRALMEDAAARYQTYQEMQRDLRRLLP